MHFGRFFLGQNWNAKDFLDTYLPSPVNICPSKSMAILKVGIWTGPLCSSSLYSNPGLNSFKAKHGFFKGWKALLLFFFFFPLFVLFENNSGKCMLGTVIEKNRQIDCKQSITIIFRQIEFISVIVSKQSFTIFFVKLWTKVWRFFPSI